MRTLRLREVKWLVHDCLVRDRKWNPGVHMLKAMFPLIPMENVEYLLWIHFLRLQKSKGTGVHAVTQIFFFLKNLFIYFNWRTVTSQQCGGPWHTSARISHRHTCGPPPSWTAVPPPSPPTPLGCPWPLALSALLHALNVHWSSVLHMVTCMFQSILLYHPTLAFSHIVQ